MPRKPIRTSEALFVFRVIAAFLGLRVCVAMFAAENTPDNQPRFLGANSCASSGCHGGGGAHQNQYIIWSLRDFHHQRPYATLTTARSKQISVALQIKDATSAHQCVECHAPLREVPETLRGDALRVNESVSCETCHAPAENWLRSHTRKDYTHADRVATGMRDLKNLYVRANTCVACHQNVSLPLLQAGHPELVFELDGQSVTEPKHWREKENWHGAQAWAVGQAVALREMLWQLDTAQNADQRSIARAEALLWLFEKIDSKSGLNATQIAKPKLREARAAADILARELAEFTWTADKTDSFLQTLAKVSGDFKKPPAFPGQYARRAERLVLALDRVSNPQPNSKGDAELKNLFALVQSIPDFNADKFARALDQFAAALDSKSSTTAASK
ncbi:MAG TPA: multiheme c-type cytochrome [Verrucomicrobiae bacterium]